MKQRRSFFSATFGEKAFDTINSILIIILSLLVLYPFWYCIILSFNDGVDALKGPLYLIPRKFTLDNYAFVLSSSQIITAAVNSVLRTVLGVLLQLLITGVAAYGLSIFCYIRAQRALGAAKTSIYYACAPFLAAGLSLLICRQAPSARFLAAFAVMAFGGWLASTDAQPACV